MERDIARSFLNRLGASGGAYPAGAGLSGAMGGSPAAGVGSLGTPGLSGGGRGMAAAGPMSGGLGMAAGGPMGGGLGMPAAGGPIGAPTGRDGGLDSRRLLSMGLGGSARLAGP